MFFDPRTPEEEVDGELGTDPGSPANWPAPARLAFIVTTATILWALIFWIVAA